MAIATRILATFQSTFWKLPTFSTESTSIAALPKKEFSPVCVTIALSSPRLIADPWKTVSPSYLVTGSDSPVSADWSISIGSPAHSLASAGTMSPRRIITTSLGTSSFASSTVHAPSRRTRAVGASEFLSASIALPALNSSTNATMPLISSSAKRNAKSFQSRSTSETIVASSIRKGIGPQKLSANFFHAGTLFSFTSLYPNSSRSRSTSAVLSPISLPPAGTTGGTPEPDARTAPEPEARAPSRSACV